MKVNESMGLVLIVLFKVQKKYGKDYCWPSQFTILKLMEEYQGVKKSRSTLNRRLRVGEDNRLIIRRRRIKRDEYQGMLFKSTLYKITIKGLRLLSGFGIDCRGEIERFEKWKENLREVNKRGVNREKVDCKRVRNIGGLVKGVVDGFEFT